MSIPGVHSLGPTCAYFEEEPGEFALPIEGAEPPKVKAQFFYISSLPIDDPLSPLPPPSSDKSAASQPPQPFSARDNAALEEAWQGFQKGEDPAKNGYSKHKAKHSKTKQMFSFPKFKGGKRSPNGPLSPVEGSDEYFGVPGETRPGDFAPQDAYDRLKQPPREGSERKPKEPDQTPKQTDLKIEGSELKIAVLSDQKSTLSDQKPKESDQKLKGSDTMDQLSEQTIEIPRKQTKESGRKHKDDSSSLPGRQQNKPNDVARKLKEEDASSPSRDRIKSRESSQKLKSEETPALSHPSQEQIKTKEASQQSKQPPVMLSQGSDNIMASSIPVNAEELCLIPADPEPEAKPKRKRRFSPFRNKDKGDRNAHDTSPDSDSASTNSASGLRLAPRTAPNAESNISGRPFARAPSNRNFTEHPTGTDGADDANYKSEDSGHKRRSSPSRRHHTSKHYHDQENQVFVPVGVSRLHLVEMPGLMMRPIYWQSINDTSNVIRGTWFYKESMLPVSAEVANRLEAGYEDMKPFSATYQDELNACIENGAAAELKVVHKLWPDDKKNSRPPTAIDSKSGSDGVGSFEAATNLNAPEVQENVAADSREPKPDTRFETCSVIYVNGRDAQILKPNQLPSESRNRRPLGAIRKARQIGVAVVRGFDRKEWRKLHPDAKMSAKAAHAAIGAYMSQSGDATTKNRRMSCATCEKETKPNVSDLVLVIHGIGQKLSERVDSFHFTHAINSFRREFNVELASEAVKGNLRNDTGIMVLPVNWRLTVNFDDEPKSFNAGDENSYQLSDITPDTLPNVRSLISDVMLDIPYYLSHHKQKMTTAVIKEANRVYRLWCRNNPGFQENGRVHLIAHSLGSAMAIDVLSQQPTKVPKKLDLTSSKVSDRLFEFNTTTLFNCGSPSGFFLLLNGANLIPRKGQEKPGMEGEYIGQGVAGEAGTYGCLAVDNVYNIIHRNDPVSYGQNACVDQSYAASLMPATIPTATPGFFSRVGSTFRIASASTGYGTPATPQRPAMNSMPSTVEMETHNFTREQIAEKRMYLLNDNGQIDYFLNSGGGPLEIQYLNMLSAHSSYWLLQDFIRFLVVEIGRAPGRDGTLPVLRARKKREYKKGSIA